MRFGREKTVYIGDGRRELAERFRAGERLSDRDLLALLLTYSLNRRDTFAVAERLLYRFHGLSGVLDAPYAVLVTVPGVTKKCAALLKTVPALRAVRFPDARRRNGGSAGTNAFPPVRKIRLKGSRRKRKRPPTLPENLRRMRGFFAGEECECEGVMLFSHKGIPLSFCRIGKGEHGVLTSDLRACTAELIRTGTAGVIVAHNHPGGPAAFSDADRLAAKAIYAVLNGMHVRAFSHVVFGKENSVLFCPPPETGPDAREEDSGAESDALFPLNSENPSIRKA